MNRYRTCALLLALSFAGCGGSEDELDIDEMAESLELDTTNRTDADGLSREQIEQRAEPLSPARAAELGIIDTSATLASPVPLYDTVIPLPLPEDTTSGDSVGSLRR